MLKSFPWLSLFEIGCGPGANLVRITKEIPGKQIGGIDINPEAIELAQKTFTGSLLKVGSADNILLSDDSVDVVLSDMTLLYVAPWDIGRYVEEMNRIGRKKIVLCEFHSDNWVRRVISHIKGRHAYNWIKLLGKHGFRDIVVIPLKEEHWSGSSKENPKRHIIVATITKL